MVAIAQSSILHVQYYLVKRTRPHLAWPDFTVQRKTSNWDGSYPECSDLLRVCQVQNTLDPTRSINSGASSHKCRERFASCLWLGRTPFALSTYGKYRSHIACKIHFTSPVWSVIVSSLSIKHTCSVGIRAMHTSASILLSSGKCLEMQALKHSYIRMIVSPKIEVAMGAKICNHYSPIVLVLRPLETAVMVTFADMSSDQRSIVLDISAWTSQSLCHSMYVD